MPAIEVRPFRRPDRDQLAALAGYRAFLAASHFTELTRTRRGWTRNPGSPGR